MLRNPMEIGRAGTGNLLFNIFYISFRRPARERTQEDEGKPIKQRQKEKEGQKEEIGS